MGNCIMGFACMHFYAIADTYYIDTFIHACMRTCVT